MKVKICGLTNYKDAQHVIEAGADFIGFIFAESKRQVSERQVKTIVSRLPAVNKVGVFAEQSVAEINRIVKSCGLDYVQLHGAESPEFCQQVSVPVIKAFKIKGEASLKEVEKYDVFGYLLDTYYEDKLGGGGESFNWNLLKGYNLSGRFFLAGGIDLNNIEQAIKDVGPFCIDVCSGVESKPGQKDHNLVEKLINSVDRESGVIDN